MSVVTDFVEKYGRYAYENEKRTGVPALVTLAQAAIESGWGKSAPGNMFFGVKADSSWTGARQYLWTTEFINGAYQKVQAWFRAYPSPLESFMDHGDFLRRNSRYKPAFQTNDPYAFAKAVANAGYATDPNYYSKVADLIGQMSVPYDAVKKKAGGATPYIAGGVALLFVGLAGWYGVDSKSFNKYVGDPVIKVFRGKRKGR